MKIERAQQIADALSTMEVMVSNASREACLVRLGWNEARVNLSQLEAVAEAARRFFFVEKLGYAVDHRKWCRFRINRKLACNCGASALQDALDAGKEKRHV